MVTSEKVKITLKRNRRGYAGFLFLCLSLFIISCSEKINIKEPVFFDETPQAIEKRMKLEPLVLDYQVDYSEHGQVGLQPILSKNGNIYFKELRWADSTGYNIKAYNLKTNSFKHLFKINTGRGPGEVLSFIDIDVWEDRIAILDRNNGKVVFFNHEGKFIEEIVLGVALPDFVKLLNEEEFLVNSRTTPEFFYHLVNQEGTVVGSFGAKKDGLNLMAFLGVLVKEDTHLYYVGWTEPAIVATDIRSKENAYVRGAIDNYSTEASYFGSASGDFVTASLTPGALFYGSAAGAYKDFIVVKADNNEEEWVKIIDVYDKTTGDYLKSYETQNTRTLPFTSIVFTDEHLILHEIDDEKGHVLNFYKNPFNED